MEKKKFKKFFTIILIIAFLLIFAGFIFVFIRKNRAMEVSAQNNYNMAFYEVVHYVTDVENYLAKSLISSTPEHSVETLTNVWREANLAQAYLAQLPVESEELSNTAKFLNQASDYSYTLSRKNIYKENLSDEDFKNLKELHQYSVKLENSLNKLSEDINSGHLKWKKITENGEKAFAQQVSNNDDLNNSEETFHQYSGLIYDGAFSDHMLNPEHKGLTSDDIDEAEAEKIATSFVDENIIKNVQSLGFSENATIPEFDFSIETNSNYTINISISKKGGHLVYMNTNRNVQGESISMEDAIKIGKDFLQNHDVDNMMETYYLKENNVATINYAYTQGGVVIYPDLIKVKVALDDGQILGVESKGYLENHCVRNIQDVKISKDDAKKTLNNDLNIKSEGLAIIPTKFQTEILCYEFKGSVEGKDFLVYINAENGREEDILMITNTPNGTLTM